MKKILITGADGQLGSDLVRVFGEGEYDVVGVTRNDFDIVDKEKTHEVVRHTKPDVILHTAAWTDTQACEENVEKCFGVNAVGAYNVAHAAAHVGARIVSISTDYVFDGSKKEFRESDVPNPLNVYGASKLAGEHLVRIANKKAHIIRTSWLYGACGHNFVSMMFEKAKRGGKIKVVHDQFGSPTYTVDLASKIKEIIEKDVPPGIYHVTNSDSCSWYEFAKKIFELRNMNVQLKPIPSDEFPSKIKRPQYSTLANNNVQKQGIALLRPWHEALADFIRNSEIRN